MVVIIVVSLLLVLFIISVYVIYRICFGEYREKYPEDDIEKQMPKGIFFQNA